MEFLFNPNVAYVFVVAAVMLLLTTSLNPKPVMLKIGTVLCLGVALYEILHLEANIWALLVAALSALPFIAGIRQTRPHLFFAALAILLLTIGAFFLFTDQNGRPSVEPTLAGLVSVFCGEFIWIAIRSKTSLETTRINNDPDSLIGIVGEARTEIYETGSVRVDGDLWLAHSEKLIPAGSMVRILRRDGLMLIVKKVERLTKR